MIRPEIVHLLWDVLPNQLNDKQKEYKINNLLRKLSKERKISNTTIAGNKLPTNRLIIWRSLVQALAGPHWKSRSYIKNVAPFSLFREQIANKIAFREHQYNLSAIIDSLILFANPIIFVRKPFFGILFSNISNTSKTIFYQGFFWWNSLLLFLFNNNPMTCTCIAFMY